MIIFKNSDKNQLNKHRINNQISINNQRITSDQVSAPSNKQAQTEREK
jgi:hypothetical protein